MAESRAELLEKAVELATEVVYVCIAKSDADGWRRLSASRPRVVGDDGGTPTDRVW